MSLNFDTDEVRELIASRTEIVQEKFGDRATAAGAMIKLLYMARSKAALLKQLVALKPVVMLQVPSNISSDAIVLAEVSNALGFSIPEVVWLTEFANSLQGDLGVVAQESEAESV